jgi:hypothetical protein
MRRAEDVFTARMLLQDQAEFKIDAPREPEPPGRIPERGSLSWHYALLLGMYL